MPNLGAMEIILIILVVVLLFGARKLPEAARSLGRSMRIFRSEVKEMGNDDKDDKTDDAVEATPRNQITGNATQVQDPGAQASSQTDGQHTPQQHS